MCDNVKSRCTLCSKVESEGFYTGCLIKDGHCIDSGWDCDGEGNLLRVVEAEDDRNDSNPK